MIDESKAKEFTDRYMELCEEYGLQIIYVPAWSKSEKETYNLEIQVHIGEYDVPKP